MPDAEIHLQREARKAAKPATEDAGCCWIYSGGTGEEIETPTINFC